MSGNHTAFVISILPKIPGMLEAASANKDGKMPSTPQSISEEISPLPHLSTLEQQERTRISLTPVKLSTSTNKDGEMPSTSQSISEEISSHLATPEQERTQILLNPVKLSSGCQTEFPSNYKRKRSPAAEDVKPNYLVNYGGIQPPTTTAKEKSSFEQYYPTKTNLIKPDPMKIPKTEIYTSNGCSVQGQGELLVPKTDITSSCRSPPSNLRSHYEPYLNQDSNSSSMSSMDTIHITTSSQGILWTTKCLIDLLIISRPFRKICTIVKDCTQK